MAPILIGNPQRKAGVRAGCSVFLQCGDSRRPHALKHPERKGIAHFQLRKKNQRLRLVTRHRNQIIHGLFMPCRQGDKLMHGGSIRSNQAAQFLGRHHIPVRALHQLEQRQRVLPLRSACSQLTSRWTHRVPPCRNPRRHQHSQQQRLLRRASHTPPHSPGTCGFLNHHSVYYPAIILLQFLTRKQKRPQQNRILSEIVCILVELVYTCRAMLTIKKLTKAHAGRTLFFETELVVNWGERIALVGPNGAGKSTLFRMIRGDDTPDEGQIVMDDYAVVGYLQQEAGDPTDRTVLEIAMSVTPEMGDAIRTLRECDAKGDNSSDEYAQAMDTFISHDGYQIEPKAKRILKGLAFKDEDFHRPAREMSGGWVMRAHMAQLLVAEPDLLMLDEPTNHLDLMSLLWFQRYLMNYPGAIFMISHDRDFMDSLVETVYDIENGELVRYTGNYTRFLELKEQRYEQVLAAWRNQQREIAHIEAFVERFRSVASKASQVQSRIKQLEKMRRIEKPRQTRRVFKFIFPQPPRSMQKVLELEKVGQSYGSKRIYKNLDLLIERGDRIVLVGPNGAGKSTLLKILAGVLPIDEGQRVLGTTTRIGYFSQMRSENLTPNYTVLEEIMKADPELREEEARAVLGSFMFRKLDCEKRVEVLSGGEKSRLSLVKFLVNPPNLLLMDEPTTHLDLMSVEALSQALKRYEGTLVFISHDVHFIRSLAEKTLHIAHGTVTPYAGGYDYYLEKSGLLDNPDAMDQ